MPDGGSSDFGERLAARMRELRAEKGQSLEVLARRSGVSRSMISLIERGETSPSAVVLEKLAAALGVTLASVFEPAKGAERSEGPIARRESQAEWRDPASGYRRRNVTPPGVGQPMQVVDVEFPAGGRVAFDSGVRDVRVHQQIWVLKGEIVITLGTERHRLRQGDCLAMQLDRPAMFHNPTRRTTRYAVVSASDGAPAR